MVVVTTDTGATVNPTNVLECQDPRFSLTAGSSLLTHRIVLVTKEEAQDLDDAEDLIARSDGTITVHLGQQDSYFGRGLNGKLVVKDAPDAKVELISGAYAITCKDDKQNSFFLGATGDTVSWLLAENPGIFKVDLIDLEGTEDEEFDSESEQVEGQAKRTLYVTDGRLHYDQGLQLEPDGTAAKKIGEVVHYLSIGRDARVHWTSNVQDAAKLKPEGEKLFITVRRACHEANYDMGYVTLGRVSKPVPSPKDMIHGHITEGTVDSI
jgi:hypothetical protein